MPELEFDVTYPAQSDRLTTLLRAPLALPHLVWLGVLAVPLYLATLSAWIAILVTGRHPERLWRFAFGVMHLTAIVQAYLLVQRDEFPPFRVAPYPVVFDLAYEPRYGRLRAVAMPLLLVPQFLALVGVFLAIHSINAIGWFGILLTGRHPRRAFDLVTGLSRWQHRVALAAHVLTPAYPPFRCR
jgi:hypothetical protein